jgi:hypothetical protein
MTTMTAAQVRVHTGGMDQVPDPEVLSHGRRAGIRPPTSCGFLRTTNSSTRPARGRCCAVRVWTPNGGSRS